MTEVLLVPQQPLIQDQHIPADLVVMSMSKPLKNIFDVHHQNHNEQLIGYTVNTDNNYRPATAQHKSDGDKSPIVRHYNHELESYKGERTQDDGDFRHSQKSNSAHGTRSIRTASEKNHTKQYRLNSNIYNIAFGELQCIEQTLNDGINSNRPHIRIKSGQKRPPPQHPQPFKQKQEILERQIHQIKSDLKSLRNRRIINLKGGPVNGPVEMVQTQSLYEYCSRMTKINHNEQLINPLPKVSKRKKLYQRRETHDIGILAKPNELINHPKRSLAEVAPQLTITRELTFGGSDEEETQGQPNKSDIKVQARRGSSTGWNTMDHIEIREPIQIIRQEGNPIEVSLPSMNMPKLPQMPNKQASSKELVQLGRKLFGLFGVSGYEEKYLMNVSKYNNCFSFSAKGLTILWYDTGRFYIGGYRLIKNQGQKHGKGIEYIPKRYIYDGEFKTNKKCGFGSLKYTNGDSYQGQFYNGLKHGKGKLLQNNGVVYNGEWKNEKMDGFGVLELTNGQRYKGFFQCGAQHGSGVIKFANGDEYKGEFVQGRFYGRGVYTWANGEIYQGDFVNGCKHGQGKWYSRKQQPSEVYIGQYKNDKKCGFGKYTWVDGTSYEGEFENDQRHGVGILNEQGKVSKGQWQNGQQSRSFDPEPKSAHLKAYYQNAKLQQRKKLDKSNQEASSSLKKTLEIKRLRSPSQSNTLSSTARGCITRGVETPSKPMQFYRRLGQTK